MRKRFLRTASPVQVPPCVTARLRFSFDSKPTGLSHSQDTRFTFSEVKCIAVIRPHSRELHFTSMEQIMGCCYQLISLSCYLFIYLFNIEQSSGRVSSRSCPDGNTPARCAFTILFTGYSLYFISCYCYHLFHLSSPYEKHTEGVTVHRRRFAFSDTPSFKLF